MYFDCLNNLIQKKVKPRSLIAEVRGFGNESCSVSERRKNK